MYYDPSCKPEPQVLEPGTLPHVIDWLRRHPADAQYNWHSIHDCCAAQYLNSIGRDMFMEAMRDHSYAAPFGGMKEYGYVCATRPWTFGAALERAEAVLHSEVKFDLQPPPSVNYDIIVVDDLAADLAANCRCVYPVEPPPRLRRERSSPPVIDWDVVNALSEPIKVPPLTATQAARLRDAYDQVYYASFLQEMPDYIPSDRNRASDSVLVRDCAPARSRFLGGVISDCCV